MTSQVSFKIDKKLKEKAMKKAQQDGLALSYVMEALTQAYVTNTVEVEAVTRPRLNEKTRKELIRISKDIKAGRNLSPTFDNAEDAIAYLKSQK